MMNHQVLIAAFAVCFLIEFVAFGMQRATLLMSREADVPPRIGLLLLPSWFPAVWLVRICKWTVLVFIALNWYWVIAMGLLIVDVVLSSILPIPYSAYVPAFRKRAQQIKQLDFEAGTALEEMLNSSKIHGS
ncbi:MAG: hypothetical protein KF751_09515 [Nitrospira sp.]|nr:hypothetical protein [Nitrospira sp.]